MILKNWRLLALAVALTTLVAACGSDSSAARNDTTSTTTTTAAMATPFGIDLALDSVGGQNLHLDLGDRQINAPSEYAEVFVDGEYWMRLYTDWVHLKLAPGDHEIRVELSGAEASASLKVPESSEMMHDHPDPIDVEGEEPEISLEVTEDPELGWNLHAEITNFRFAPEHASSDPVPGEGHVHVFVDGIKVQRLYGEWWHFADLTPGEHEVSVELNANNHAPYHHNNEPITARVLITVAGDAMVMPDDSVPPAEGDHVKVEASFAGGEVTGTDNRIEVAQGQTVMLMITSDVAEHVHVHGYDIFLDVGPGDTATMMFTADIPGVFEIEFEDSGVLIAELEVR